MSYLEKIERCNDMRRDKFEPLCVGEARVGWIRDDLAPTLKEYDDTFVYHEAGFNLHEQLETAEQRTQAVERVVSDLIARGVINNNYHEIYPVTSGHRERPEFLIDRGVASYFGTRTFGQHLNGYVMDGDEILMWIGRRARDRGYEPGKLDQLVAGGFPYGVSSAENLRKECMEEAGMSAELADQAKAVRAISCCYENERGVKPEVLYCYDLQLPEYFQPVCTDGEVDEFMLIPIQDVAEIVRDTFDFKLNCNLVVIDFLIRHGVLTPDDDDYDLLATGLHQ